MAMTEESNTKVSTTVIPAQPGYWRIQAHGVGTKDVFATKEPIIAWRITVDEAPDLNSCVTPICLDDHSEAPDASPYAILQPDGRVCRSYVQDWESLQAWCAHYKITKALG
jgi:hypothetical protein